MVYDHWKTTNPADEWLGPDPEWEHDEREPESSAWLDWHAAVSRQMKLEEKLHQSRHVRAILTLEELPGSYLDARAKGGWDYLSGGENES